MKKLIYVFLIAFVTISFSGCDRNKSITCTDEEKENIYCKIEIGRASCRERV